MVNSPEILHRLIQQSRPIIPPEFIPDEKRIIDGTPSSPRPWSFYKEVFLFPEVEKMKGLRVLDIGGGCSDATARLMELGADAYSIDPQYTSIKNIEGRGKWYLEELSLDTQKDDEGREWLRQQKEAYRVFLASMRKDPSRYIPASATAIPFGNATFDIVISSVCITGHLDVNREVFKKAVQECIRVTRGVIQLHPWAKPIIVRGIENPIFKRGLRAFQDTQVFNQLTLLAELLEREDLRTNYYESKDNQGLTFLMVKVTP